MGSLFVDQALVPVLVNRRSAPLTLLRRRLLPTTRFEPFEYTALRSKESKLRMRRIAALLVVARRAAALRPPTRMKRTTALNAAVEVEEKFAASIEPEALEKRVRELGGEVLRTVEFYDEYFDTEELTLTTRDTWLRRRDGAWELKVPAESRRKATGGETTAFREIEDVSSIAAELASLGVAGFPDATSLKPFAAFGTRRDKYTLNEVSVDVDAASYGHSIMELEVMTDGSESDIERARGLIAAAAVDLGCEKLGDTGGKLETYLRRFCPRHAAALGFL